MSVISENIESLHREIPAHVKLIAVSKTKPTSDILEAYTAGQKFFGENYVQEISEKISQLPSDIEWHFIGHLQSNKVKYIAPYIHWIHGVESEKLLQEISKQSSKHNRHISCLLQIHIAQEESKFGFSPQEAEEFCRSFDPKKYPGIALCGLMGMATFTDDSEQIRHEFRALKTLFTELKSSYFTDNLTFTEISMGMSADWKIAVEEGSTMVRIGSAIFGNR